MIKPVATPALPAPSAAASAPRFGWRTPPRPVVLEPADVRDARTGEPADAFVARVAEQLPRRSVDDPGCVIIPNACEVLEDGQAIQDFQERLMKRVGAFLQREQPDFFNYRLPFDPAEVRAEDALTVVSQLDKPFDRQNVGGKVAGYFHWDNWNWPLIAFHYPAVGNVKGGKLRLFDAMHWMADSGKMLPDISTVFRNFSSLKEPCGSDPDLAARYAIEIDPADKPVVLVNNRTSAGVAHGPSDTEPLAPGERLTRDLFHTRISLPIRFQEPDIDLERVKRDMLARMAAEEAQADEGGKPVDLIRADEALDKNRKDVQQRESGLLLADAGVLASLDEGLDKP